MTEYMEKYVRYELHGLPWYLNAVDKTITILRFGYYNNHEITDRVEFILEFDKVISVEQSIQLKALFKRYFSPDFNVVLNTQPVQLDSDGEISMCDNYLNKTVWLYDREALSKQEELSLAKDVIFLEITNWLLNNIYPECILQVQKEYNTEDLTPQVYDVATLTLAMKWQNRYSYTYRDKSYKTHLAEVFSEGGN